MNGVKARDELDARRELYESAVEIKKAITAPHEPALLLNSLVIWQDAVLDYLKRTGRGPDDTSPRGAVAIGALKSVRELLRAGLVGNAAAAAAVALNELGER